MKDDSETASPDPLCGTASTLLSDWRELLSRLVGEAESFTREKPGVGLTAAFFVGAFLGSFLRRR